MTSELGAALLVGLAYGAAVAAAGVPVVVLAFVLASSRPPAVGLVFAAGWALGLAAALGVVVAVSDVTVLVSSGSGAPGGSDAGAAEAAPSSAVLSWVRSLAGVALLVLALRSWRARGTAKQPAWMKGVAGWGPRKAFLTGLGLGALNPKNLAIIASAASSLLAVTVSAAVQAPTVLVFAVVGSVGVGGPAIYRVAGGRRAGHALARGDEWLQARAAVLSAVVLAVLGVVVLVNGVTGL